MCRKTQSAIDYGSDRPRDRFCPSHEADYVDVSTNVPECGHPLSQNPLVICDHVSQSATLHRAGEPVETSTFSFFLERLQTRMCVLPAPSDAKVSRLLSLPNVSSKR